MTTMKASEVLSLAGSIAEKASSTLFDAAHTNKRPMDAGVLLAAASDITRLVMGFPVPEYIESGQVLRKAGQHIPKAGGDTANLWPIVMRAVIDAGLERERERNGGLTNEGVEAAKESRQRSAARRAYERHGLLQAAARRATAPCGLWELRLNQMMNGDRPTGECWLQVLRAAIVDNLGAGADGMLLEEIDAAGKRLEAAVDQDIIDATGKNPLL